MGSQWPSLGYSRTAVVAALWRGRLLHGLLTSRRGAAEQGGDAAEVLRQSGPCKARQLHHRARGRSALRAAPLVARLDDSSVSGGMLGRAVLPLVLMGPTAAGWRD
jgi:hypothetical protein